MAITRDQAHKELRASTAAKPITAPITNDDDLATSIRKISEASRQLTTSGLNRRAIVCLLSDYSGVNKTTCGQVLDSLGELASKFCVPASEVSKRLCVRADCVLGQHHVGDHKDERGRRLSY